MDIVAAVVGNEGVLILGSNCLMTRMVHTSAKCETQRCISDAEGWSALYDG